MDAAREFNVPWSLEELPLPLATLERDWARERRRRVEHAHRYE